MAFTTTVGAGGTSLIGTSGVDTTAFDPGTLSNAVFIGAQGDADVVNIQNNTALNFSVSMGSGNDVINSAGFRNSTVRLDDGNDTLTMTGAIRNATVSGLNGIDTITATNVQGGFVNGNNDDDVMTLTGTLSESGKFVGGQGSDTIVINGATLTSGIINGQDGADTITVTAITAAGTSVTIYGGQGSDNMTNNDATPDAVIFSGDLGNDTLTGAGGADTLLGGDGSDRVSGLGGADSMSGGSGGDTFIQANNASLSASALSPAAGANWAAGDTITFGNGAANARIDVITDFTGGTGGDLFAVGGVASGTLATALLGTNIGTGTGVTAGTATTASQVYYASGNFNATTGVFTFTANGAGADTLLIVGSGGLTTAQNFGGTAAGSAGSAVLVGTNYSTLTAANF